MLNVNTAWAAALALLVWFAAADARGESVPTRLQLANCPTPVSLSLPELFANGADVRKDYDTDLIKPFATIVLAVKSPAKPSVTLIVTDSKRIAAKQGSFTLGDIEDIKARVSQVDTAKTAEKTNELLGSSLIDLDRLKIVAKESGDTWVILVSEIAMTGEGAAFQGYLGMKINLVSRCLVNTMVTASASSVTADELLAIMRAIGVE